jgi:hypothetical protein
MLCSAVYLKVVPPEGMRACPSTPEKTVLQRAGKKVLKPHDGVLNIESVEQYMQLFKNTNGKQRGLMVLAFHTENGLAKLLEIGHNIRFSSPELCALARMNVDKFGFELAEKFKITKSMGSKTVLDHDVVLVGVKRGSPFEDPYDGLWHSGFEKIGFDFQAVKDDSRFEMKLVADHFYPGDPDSELYQKEMTGERAHKVCLKDQECAGMSFSGSGTSEETTIFFKNKEVGGFR